MDLKGFLQWFRRPAEREMVGAAPPSQYVEFQCSTRGKCDRCGHLTEAFNTYADGKVCCLVCFHGAA